MIIGERTLLIERLGAKPVRVSIHIFSPIQSDKDWSCTFEIDWPKGQRRMATHGIDAMQALQLALSCIGAELYCSDYHKRGELVWQKLGKGYGFPITSNLRDMLVGDDKGFFE